MSNCKISIAVGTAEDQRRENIVVECDQQQAIDVSVSPGSTVDTGMLVDPCRLQSISVFASDSIEVELLPVDPEGEAIRLKAGPGSPVVWWEGMGVSAEYLVGESVSSPQIINKSDEPVEVHLGLAHKVKGARTT